MGLSLLKQIISYMHLRNSGSFPESAKVHRTAVEEEFRKNRLVGERTGCWKGGVLVEDDSGSVKRALEQLQS